MHMASPPLFPGITAEIQAGLFHAGMLGLLGIKGEDHIGRDQPQMPAFALDLDGAPEAIGPNRGSDLRLGGIGDVETENTGDDVAEHRHQVPSATFTLSPSCSLSRLSPASRSPAERPDRMVTAFWVFRPSATSRFSILPSEPMTKTLPVLPLAITALTGTVTRDTACAAPFSGRLRKATRDAIWGRMRESLPLIATRTCTVPLL